MDSVKPRYTKEEFARRGDAIYEREILPKLAAKDVGKFLAIYIETGEFEIAADEMKAGDKLLARIPGAQIWMVRIGHASTRSFGSRDPDFEFLSLTCFAGSARRVARTVARTGGRSATLSSGPAPATFPETVPPGSV
jgi:hypothetical protein